MTAGCDTLAAERAEIWGRPCCVSALTLHMPPGSHEDERKGASPSIRE